MRKKFFILTIICVIMLAGCSNVAENEGGILSEQQNLEEVSADNVKTTNLGDVQLEASKLDDVQAENPSSEDVQAEFVRVVSSENTWAYDVTDPLAVCEHSDYLLKIRVKTKEKTKYFIKNAIMPARTYNVEVLDVLMNDDDSVPKNIKLAVNGGIVSMQEYVNTMNEETKIKTNANKLTQKELEEMILINDESYYELVQDQEYYIFVRDLTDDENYKGYYGMPVGGYDVFQEKDGEYINVLTNAKLDVEMLSK